MVVGAFPIAKLGVLFLKQLSKPIANYVKDRAKSHPTFRRYVCIPPARFYNWCEIHARMWILNLGKPTNVPPMNEAMAIELGANLLGEGILFVIAAALLLFEYSRQSANNERKEKAQKEEMDDLKSIVKELSLNQESHNAKIRELFRVVYDIDSRVVKMPWSPKENPYKDDSGPIPSLKKPNEVVNDHSVISEAIAYIYTIYQHRNAECCSEQIILCDA